MFLPKNFSVTSTQQQQYGHFYGNNNTVYNESPPNTDETGLNVFNSSTIPVQIQTAENAGNPHVSSSINPVLTSAMSITEQSNDQIYTLVNNDELILTQHSGEQ